MRQAINGSGDDGVEKLITSMNGTNDPSDASGSKVGSVINTVIGLLQVAGSGISLIVITMLGIKYILASPGEKADVKKAIMPILIGCVLLFGAVNLMGMLASFSDDIFKTGP